MFTLQVRTLGRVAIAVTALAGGLLAPAGLAHAARLDPVNRCLEGGEKVTITGGGFTPGATATVAVQEGASYPAAVETNGSIRVDVRAPTAEGSTVRERSFTVTATDDADPSNIDAMSVFVTRTRPITNAPVTGNPSAVVTWEFSNFTPRRWIYGHFRLRGRTIRTVRFGRAGTRTPCGYLKTRARRVPVRPLSAGRWTLQIDQARRYLRTRKPRYVVEFSIMRSPRLGR